MFGRIWSSLAKVADGINALAESLFALSTTFREANAHVRQRLELEVLPAPAPAQLTVLTAQPEQQAPLLSEPVAAEPSSKSRRSKIASA